MGFRPCWYPSPFPPPSISRCFLFTLLQQPLDFIRLFFTVAISAPTTNPPPYSRLGTGTTVIGYPKRLRYHGGGVMQGLCMHALDNQVCMCVCVYVCILSLTETKASFWSCLFILLVSTCHNKFTIDVVLRGGHMRSIQKNDGCVFHHSIRNSGARDFGTTGPRKK